MSGGLTVFCSYFQPLMYFTQVIFNKLEQLPFFVEIWQISISAKLLLTVAICELE
jgi:hypothetical protein